MHNKHDCPPFCSVRPLMTAGSLPLSSPWESPFLQHGAQWDSLESWSVHFAGRRSWGGRGAGRRGGGGAGATHPHSLFPGIL
jgi:hypothetical protein